MELLSEVRAAALKRPRLIVPIAFGTILQLVLGAVSSLTGALLISKTLFGVAATVAVAAVFAEMWRDDGRGIGVGGVCRALGLLLMSYPLLLLFGLVSAPLTYFLLQVDQVALIYLLICAGKLIAFGATVLSVLAIARRDESTGVLQAFGRGWRLMRANAGFILVLLMATYLIQEAAVYATGLVYFSILPPGSEAGVVIKTLTSLLATAISLFGCVAFPLQAVKSGRLKS